MIARQPYMPRSESVFNFSIEVTWLMAVCNTRQACARDQTARALSHLGSPAKPALPRGAILVNYGPSLFFADAAGEREHSGVGQEFRSATTATTTATTTTQEQVYLAPNFAPLSSVFLPAAVVAKRRRASSSS